MSSTTPCAFQLHTPVPTRPLSACLSTCTFVARPTHFSAAPSRHSSLRMAKDWKEGREDGYVIRESEFRDPEGQVGDDDSGDGFMGEAAMDDMLGVSMPDDLPSFEIKEIQAAKNRDELVAKLKDIAVRRRDIIDDRRKGMGMDNVNNYLNNL